MPALLIVDPSLVSFEGHSYNYDRALYAAARELFATVTIYADRRFEVARADVPIQAELNHAHFDRIKRLINRGFHFMRPALPDRRSRALSEMHATVAPNTSAWVMRLAKRLHAIRFERNLHRVLDQSDGQGIQLLIQHAFIPDLIVLHKWLRKRIHPQVRFHVVLRYAPDLVNSEFMPAANFDAMLRELADPDHGNCRFYTDSERLSQNYRDVARCAAATLPLPIPPDFMDIASSSPSSRDLALGFLGSSRADKGFRELPRLVRTLPAKAAGMPVRALVQISTPPPDCLVEAAIDEFKAMQAETGAFPTIELLDSPVPADVYYSWFRRVRIIVLPYVAKRYEGSTSGVLVEAILSGVPVLVPSGTWLADQVSKARDEHNCVIGEIFADTAELPGLVERMAAAIDRYRADVQRYSQVFRAIHDPRRCAEMIYERSIA